MRSTLALAVVALALAACGGDNKSAAVDAADPDGHAAICGNLQLEDGEDCDKGNTALTIECDSTCHFTCGNGVFDDSVGEICDTAILSGAGSCPTACNDNDACTSDVLSGSGCMATCLSSPITAPVDGDGCCPTGANANTDSDCTAMCGNGILEAGELCDPGITAGVGACPSTCNDAQACTSDQLMSAGSCQAHCVFTAITAPANGDGCCPTGANSTTDTDCSVLCGNGIKEAGETCDTAIATGPNACPTSCNDNVACTSNVLSNPGTCTAACVFPPITTAVNGDGCCPTGANANTDNDCQPVCPNGVREGTEQCDDGNMINTDACSNTCQTNVVPTAFRFNTLVMKDPHAFTRVFGFCVDITTNLNDEFTKNITMDGTDPDTFLDLSPVLVFRPLNQGATATTPLEVHFANCTSPMSSTTCSPGVDPPILLTATNMAAGTCLAPIAGTVRPYNPAVTNATGPCFSSPSTTVTVKLAGVPVTLHDARVAATYSGNPATQVVNGLLYGFLTEADADATLLPTTITLVGGQPFSSILRGGTGNCQPAPGDKDLNNGVSGWWIYLNFTAPVRPWSDN